jgi:diguanylate cyclase (GGDEF)-like protein/PAS domain S-box-containing protein
MSSETILVVDDNRQIANYLAGKILPGLGYDTLTAYDGKTALSIIKKEEIALMLLDFQLTDTTGLALLRQLVDEGFNIPTILVTAHGSEQVVVDAFHLGVQDYLTKPVDADSLEIAISRALTESRLRKEKEKLTAQLNDQVSWLTVLSKIGQSVTSTLDVDDVLRRIVEAGVFLTHAEEGFLSLLDDESGQLYLRAVKNIDQEKSKLIHLPVSDSLVGTVVRTLKPLRMAQSNEGSQLKVSTGFLVNSFLHVPILSKGKAVGVLSIDNRKIKHSFTEVDENMLTSLADYAAVAIENANLYLQAQQELTERRRIEQELRTSEERYALAVEGANDGIWDWDLKTGQIYYSTRWKSMLGYQDEEINNSPNEWFSRIHPEDIEQTKLDISAHLKGVTSHFENEHRMLHKDGTYRWVVTRGIAVWDKESIPHRMAGSQSDITDRKVAEQRLLHDAFHDALTSLPNRALFMDRLGIAVERAKRHDKYAFAVLFMDLDRFKDVNDSLGHLMGDDMLVSTSKLLKAGLRPTDTVARLGGDEFVILLEDITGINDATLVADRVQKELGSSIVLNDRVVFASASIGIVLSSTGYSRAEEVLRDADIAMYRAKANGKARYEIFDPAMRDRIIQRLTREDQLRKALENHDLQVYYQPIISLSNDRMIGLEALVRWNHRDQGLLFPMDFIQLAEETGLIIPLDRWVMHEACRQLQEWKREIPGLPPLTVNVNMSGKQIGQPDLIDQIELILKETGLDPSCLKIEITESAFMENNELTTDMFNQLQSIGVQVQIDDFGIGYTSLSYLSHFPINALKIDQSFVNGLTVDGNDTKIVNAIVMLTHGLGMGVIAEGVETADQLAQLKELGCEYAQGYLVSVPLDSSQVKKLLEKGIKNGGPTFPSLKTAKALDAKSKSDSTQEPG